MYVVALFISLSVTYASIKLIFFPFPFEHIDESDMFSIFYHAIDLV